MSTTSKILMSAPHGSNNDPIVILVHYDGDDVGNDLAQIIARDGYPKVFQTFSDQPSRMWRELHPAASGALAANDQDGPADATPVGGYGVVFIGDYGVTAEDIGDGTDWDRDCSYHVDGDGRVTTAP
ncbi:hypothetical protein GS896_27595 [Rhodococcus hoagii]|nr:hypothetical protein [Prescottella equi]MBM4654017.1 hypothetical protein [Prescottella equi]MBM4719721.1 hypothetical protein [Prescottella equi]NKR23517.1 hypothetical protein [Prescottella equi]NKT56329.1 hypothetical protein [Prescottella equi]